MTKITKPRFKNYKKEFSFFNRKRRIRPTWHKLNIKIWDDLEYKKKFNRIPHARDNYWRLNYKSKQEIKAFYGGISESMFQKINKKNRNNRELLISEFETRLDVIVFKLNWAMSIYHAKQLINHGHLMVNHIVMKIPSYIIKPGDLIQVSSKSESRNLIKTIIKKKLSRIDQVVNSVYNRRVPYFLGGRPNLRGKLEHWLIIPMCLEVDYFSMSAILLFKNENERLLMYHPLRPYRYWKIN